MYSLCCISNVLKEQGISFGTTTKKRFLQLERKEAVALASSKALQNVTTTFKTIKYCYDNGWNYRVSCNLFPLLSLPEANLVYEEYPDFKKIEDVFEECAAFVKDTNIRLSNHPDQFIVLGSEKDNVINNSIRELEINAWIMDKLGCTQSYYNPINLHVNKNGDCRTIAERVLTNLKRCSQGVQSRLVLENEDKGIWNVTNMLEYFGKHLPITYDNLHDECNSSLKSGETGFKECVETWLKFNVKPLFHYSESDLNNTNKRAHALSPAKLPKKYTYNVDFEVELKDKDNAITRLQLLNI